MGIHKTVFVCSTLNDLVEERAAVLDAIRRLKLQHDAMEFFGARTSQPIETCLEEVRLSDILVVIVGYKYGSIVSEMGISFSEAEYNEGVRLGKPCLVYIRDETVPILPKHIEQDPNKIPLLAKWKELLYSRHTPYPFQDGHNLALQLSADLSRLLNELAQVEARAKSFEQSHNGSNLMDKIDILVSDALYKGMSERSIFLAVRTAVSSLLSDTFNTGPKVFLSYSDSDKRIAEKIADRMTSAGFDVWFADQNLKLGSSIIDEIGNAISICDFMVFLISPESTQRAWPRQELDFAFSRRLSNENKPIILPVIVKGTIDEQIPVFLRDTHWVDLRKGKLEKGIAQLINRIKNQPGAGSSCHE